MATIISSSQVKDLTQWDQKVYLCISNLSDYECLKDTLVELNTDVVIVIVKDETLLSYDYGHYPVVFVEDEHLIHEGIKEEHRYHLFQQQPLPRFIDYYFGLKSYLLKSQGGTCPKLDIDQQTFKRAFNFGYQLPYLSESDYQWEDFFSKKATVDIQLYLKDVNEEIRQYCEEKKEELFQKVKDELNMYLNEIQSVETFVNCLNARFNESFLNQVLYASRGIYLEAYTIKNEQLYEEIKEKIEETKHQKAFFGSRNEKLTELFELCDDFLSQQFQYFCLKSIQALYKDLITILEEKSITIEEESRFDTIFEKLEIKTSFQQRFKQIIMKNEYETLLSYDDFIKTYVEQFTEPYVIKDEWIYFYNYQPLKRVDLWMEALQVGCIEIEGDTAQIYQMEFTQKEISKLSLVELLDEIHRISHLEKKWMMAVSVDEARLHLQEYLETFKEFSAYKKALQNAL